MHKAPPSSRLKALSSTSDRRNKWIDFVRADKSVDTKCFFFFRTKYIEFLFIELNVLSFGVFKAFDNFFVRHLTVLWTHLCVMNALMVGLMQEMEMDFSIRLVSAFTAWTSNDTSPNRSWPRQLARNFERLLPFASLRLVAMINLFIFSGLGAF